MTLEELSDRQAIVDVTISYTWALDEHRFEDLRDVFTPDVDAHLGNVQCDGIDAVIAKCSSSLGHLDSSQHLIGNHQIQVDGDRANCRCYLQAQHTKHGAEGGDNWIFAGIYTDELVRTDAGWRISKRVLSHLWTEGNATLTKRT